MDADRLVGTELAGYRLEALVGRGRNGVVYLAEDARLNRRVALRLLSPELAADEQFREQFLREARLAALLDHPGIVPVHEAGEADGQLYVAVAHVEGTDLASLLVQEERLEPERALAMVGELADALDAARWGRGLVHGNLEPGEVLVAGERILLSGFGERRELPSGAGLAVAARHFDTGGYPAPEQIEGRPVSPRTDVYALGCLLVECLTGSPPFNAPSPEALLRAHLYEPPPSVRSHGLPAAIDRVIAKAMAKWPEERYSTCTELAAAARAAVAGRAQPGQARSALASPSRPGQTVPAEPPPFEVEEGEVGAPDGLAARLATRRQKATAAIGLAALLALVAGAIWLMNDARSTSAEPSAGPEPAAAQTLGEVAVVDGDAAPATDGEASAEPSSIEPAAEASLGDTEAQEPVLSRVPGSLVRIDAKTGRILARLAIPSPKLLASDGRSVWVLSDDEPGDRLIRIDAATNAVTDSFDVDVAGVAAEFGAPEEPSVPTELAVAGGSAWLGVSAGPVFRFAPGASAGEAAHIDTDSPWFQSPFGGAGSLWVRNGEGGGGVLRVDPDSERILADLSPIDQVVAAGPGFVWALDDPGGPNPGLVRIDTDTNAVAPLGDAPRSAWLDFAVADGALWASREEPDTIVRLDPVTGDVEGEIDVVPIPGPIAAGGGAVWAASRDPTKVDHDVYWYGTLARYDIATGLVERIVVGGMPSDLVFARGSVWAAVPGQLNSGSPVEDWGYLGTDRLSLTVDRVPFSFRLQTGGSWETGDWWERFGSTSINKYISGGQDAEAIIFWKTLPSDENADPCVTLPGASAADIAAAVASAPGTELVAGPSDVTVGGRAAKHVVVRVREDVGCDPGFFFTWAPPDGGAFWLDTLPGDTIRVWIVDVDGTHFVIEAETRPNAGPEVEQEIQEFIESIRFEGA